MKIILLENFVYNPYTGAHIPKGTVVTLVDNYKGIVTIRYRGYTYVSDRPVRYERSWFN